MSKQTREQFGVKSGDVIVLKGTVSFARVDKLVDGEDLVKENQRRASLGGLSTKAFRSISIEDPEVVQGQNTPLANFYAQSAYVGSKSNKQTISIESKSPYAPKFGHIVNGQIVEIEDPAKNPAPGQVVYLMIDAFTVKGFNNMGSSFNAIVFEEGDISFYDGGGNSLAGFGSAMNMPFVPLPTQQPVHVAQEQTQQAPVEQPVQQNQNFGQAPQQQQGFNQAPQQQQGFAQAPPAQNAFNQPQAPVTPATPSPFGQNTNAQASGAQPNPFDNQNATGANADSPYA